VQITRFKDKTKYVCATFDPLIRTNVEDDTGGKKIISGTVRSGLVFLLFYFKYVQRYLYKTPLDLFKSIYTKNNYFMLNFKRQ